MGGHLRAFCLPSWALPGLQVVLGKNVSGVLKKLEGTSVISGVGILSFVLLQLSEWEAPALAHVLPPQWQKHHDNPHELSKQEGREGRGGLGAITDHSSLRAKRKRRRPAKTECPSLAHRGDSHEEGTLGMAVGSAGSGCPWGAKLLLS